MSADLAVNVDHPCRGVLGFEDLPCLSGGIGTDSNFEADTVDEDACFIFVHIFLLFFVLFPIWAGKKTIFPRKFLQTAFNF